MGNNLPMTPHEYVAEIDRLIAAGRDEAALEFASRVDPAVVDKLPPDEFFRVCGMLEGAEMAVAAASLLSGNRA